MAVVIVHDIDRLTRNPAAFPSRRNARACASVGGDGAAWLEGHAEKAFACDASIRPVVTAGVYPAVLDDLVRLCLEPAGIVPAAAATAPTSAAATQASARTAPARAGPSWPTRARPCRASLRPCRPRPCLRPPAAGRHWSRRSSGKPRFFYCTLARRFTCGDVHDEGIGRDEAVAVNGTGAGELGDGQVPLARVQGAAPQFPSQRAAPRQSQSVYWSAGKVATRP